MRPLLFEGVNSGGGPPTLGGSLSSGNFTGDSDLPEFLPSSGGSSIGDGPAIFDDGAADYDYPDALADEEEMMAAVAEENGEEPGGTVINMDDDYFDDGEEPLFSPPLYIQRYCAVENVIESFVNTSSVTSLLDLGCAELKFMVRAKNGKQFQRIVGLDLDEFTVGSNSRRIQPGIFEMINKREQPLKMEVYCGDATVPDQRLLNIDVVTAIELIEHMEPETHGPLAAAIFDVIQPKLVVFTTPNVEYNPLFPGGSLDLRRHWDHRFEWTRAQFQDWARGVTQKYPAYNVQFQGVGYGPDDTVATHGCCSQIAVFLRDPEIPKARRQVVTQPHKIMRDVDYPWSPPKTLTQELHSVMDSECYTTAKELQEAEELAGIYNREWFTFTVEQFYAARWRLQSLLEEKKPDNEHFEMIRAALRTLHKDWVKFDEENDQISYFIQQPEMDSDSPTLDMESSLATGYYPLSAEDEFALDSVD